ncbi:MAG: restriction endonuclease subunit R [Phormidesmis sp.]
MSSLTLSEVKQRFGLGEVRDLTFFPEWQGALPENSALEQLWLDKLRADFLSLEQYPLHEELVKMAMLGPLLSLAGFFQYPFYPQAEAEVLFTAEDEGEVVKGRVDVLVVRERFWVAVIESKNKRFSLIEAVPQALAYMMTSPNLGLPTFGLVTNGTHFTFLKLAREGTPQYALSDELTLKRQGNELYQVLGILRKLGGLVVEWETSLSA